MVPILSKKTAKPNPRLKRPAEPQTLAGFLKENPEAEICVYRKNRGLGDVVMLLPALKEIKRRYPHCHLTVGLHGKRNVERPYLEIVENLGFIDKIVPAGTLDTTRYDFVFDATHVCLPYERQHSNPANRIDLFGSLMGLTHLQDKQPTFILSEEELCFAKQSLESLTGKKIVSLHIASHEDKRSWPLERYIELIELSASENPNIHFLIFDTLHKRDIWSFYPNCTDFSETSMREMAALIQCSDLFIGPDSGPMHIAGALGTSSLVLFGSTSPQSRINHYPSHTAISLNLDCQHCWYKPCHLKRLCMREITARQVKDHMIESIG